MTASQPGATTGAGRPSATGTQAAGGGGGGSLFDKGGVLGAEVNDPDGKDHTDEAVNVAKAVLRSWAAKPGASGRAC
jgi:hypothetical protein